MPWAGTIIISSVQSCEADSSSGPHLLYGFEKFPPTIGAFLSLVNGPWASQLCLWMAEANQLTLSGRH